MLRWNEEAGEVTVFRAPSNYSNGNTRDRPGRLITCEHDARRVTRTEYDGAVTVLIDRFGGRRLNAPNDVVVHSDDSIWFTDPGYGILMNYEGERAEFELHRSVYRLDPDMSFDALTAEAAQVAAGSEGLTFLPYLTGERMPYPDPSARGAWVGLTVRHRRGHLTRAVLEGVAFGMKDGFELMRQVGLSAAEQVRVSGGGAKSRLWRQILASVLNAELATVNTTEGAAYGAALLAGVGAGVWPDVPAACAAAIAVTGHDRPVAADAAVYQRSYERYHALYPALKPAFSDIGDS